MKKKIVFTGGGSAGHVTVNLALIPHFLHEGWGVEYIGSENGIERELISKLKGVHYHSIKTGKLRRYFDWNNVKDPFRVVQGIFQSFRIIQKSKPNVVFSKGGFVSVPVILGSKLNQIPVLTHESDLTPGLANKISMPFVKKVCTTFPETEKHLSSKKAEYVGAIVRDELRHGNATKGYTYCNFIREKPVLLIMGGSMGSQKINKSVRDSLDELLSNFQIVHICGKGGVDSSIKKRGYKQFEYINEQLPDMMHMADIVISRAGSNAIFEFLSLKKPMLLIPLSKEASRGDQILNAESFKKAGYCEVLQEEELSKDSLTKTIKHLYKNKENYINKMKTYQGEKALSKVIKLIKNEAI
ncbi:undecaprenyldiphospho-muramoylpentapeptide beta-N-acetylglucosaminyltransferase [Chengkuizengella axinellae]|uniref:UDP-N-acetylglucosamine--N-acetylmuramyl-(pentapeptide) pyrophosphoryl-undecaprenol N-acetylglucosamine transferase n=1 Tax=Chengkuizengella axinellae TaxID=3064388 RepID=A0ABT9IWZ6_9BACL|nr:undecaprenyldiphospho-muramoylpentapeptide beta-N-acetylglucosaminyltransferase [Chengkuizengella sp. 2205SS18-9]MDP5273871.1 undecaprenyldiphospho-muramoylpentapeptide beta-N-acetylglucosaminyltransferase [Chengkuizengella sp. 2205SS18-9]